jgi:hypothetical protein
VIITSKRSLLQIFKYGKSEIPGYVKYGIPAAMLATYGAAKKEEPDDLDQEIAQNYTDNSGLKELIATYPNHLDFKFKNRIN